jgi:hypothetical protein
MTWEAGGKLRQKPYVLGNAKDALIPNKRDLLLSIKQDQANREAARFAASIAASSDADQDGG